MTLIFLAIVEATHRSAASRFLETAYSALEAAGYDANRFAGKIGVFGGVGRNAYMIQHIAPNGFAAGILMNTAWSSATTRFFDHSRGIQT
ncbi:MAG: hypothetical protein R3C26_19815 [Calditrichia bacterium]